MATPVPARGATAPMGAGPRRRRLVVRGIVQGVGFRPFVYGLAHNHGLSGSVHNTSGAVVIEVEGAPAALDTFATELQGQAPPLARIDDVSALEVAVQGVPGFVILESRGVEGAYQPIAADAATCDECLGEVRDPGDRRHGYAFTNCTNCGPRFTIIEDVPYDRALTTMRAFTMCTACAAEYVDPANRRFHAQPNACAACGPRVWLAGRDGVELAGDAVAGAAAALRSGSVVAVKGLGGFQLAVLAADEAAITRLRARKRRPHKPFAVMAQTLEEVRVLAVVSDAEARVLSGPARPVVLLQRRRDTPGLIADGVAPGLDEVGVMLPATPLHHLLLAAVAAPLVMTSGNVTDEPIAKDNDEAVERLGAVADAFLLHDRDIYARYDDSVVRVIGDAEHVVRRARGYCPLPIDVAVDTVPVLAYGAHLKNTFCLVRDGRAFVGPHLGDLDNPHALRHHEEALATYLRLFRAAPASVAADLHPDYASTRLAERWWQDGAAPVQVQHHHAHVASVMAEHRLKGQVLGVAFDGTGYGDDGTIWGGELLVCDETSFRRVGHLVPAAQPGGDRCAREGWRMALAYALAAGLDAAELPAWLARGPGAPDARAWRLVGRVAATPGSPAAPRSSSAGRLFDAVASIVGAGHVSSFEAAAAMRLEAMARTAPPVEAITVRTSGTPLLIDAPGLVAALIAQRQQGRAAAEVAAVFHESLALAVADACALLAGAEGIERVALSGGVFQNVLLLQRTTALLRERELTVFTNHAVPANDGGVSLGQAYVAASRQVAAASRGG